MAVLSTTIDKGHVGDLDAGVVGAADRIAVVVGTVTGQHVGTTRRPCPRDGDGDRAAVAAAPAAMVCGTEQSPWPLRSP